MKTIVFELSISYSITLYVFLLAISMVSDRNIQEIFRL